jgi:hypothetical protein
MSMTDTDLLDVAAGFREGIVGTGPSTARCAMVCYPLAGYLDFLGVAVDVCESVVGDWNHIWLRLPDGRVLDPTADQFDAALPAVYLGPRLSLHESSP